MTLSLSTLVGRLRHPRTSGDFVLAGALIFVAIAGLTGAFWISRYAIAIERLSRGVGQTAFYSADGQLWFQLDERRQDVPLTRISPDLQHAVVAVEDRRFHAHPGIDPLAIARAAVRNLRAGRSVEGGSTLTQQLARTLFLSTSRTYARKFKEMLLAAMIERQLSKPQILELYLNRIYLGGNVHGVEAMSRNVFGKSAADLTLAESAFIAGLIRAPSGLSPWSRFDRALARSHLVLERMQAAGFISPEAEQAAEAAGVKVLAEPGLTAGASGYAVEFLREQFRSAFGDDDPPDWKVLTSFVPAIQAAAERAVVDGLQRLRVRGLQAALVALDPHTGDVLALVGGRDFGRTPFNRAVSARRQPGSAFKPLLYAAALEGGLSPTSVVSHLSDLAVAGPHEWVVRNATATDTSDSLTLREALLESNNQAAVRLQEQIGSKPVLQFARAVGLPDLPDVPSLALGTGEVTPLALTTAYATFANGGFAVTPRSLIRVMEADGSVALDNPETRTRVISDAAAFQMTTMLKDVIDRGTGSAARALGVSFPAAGKTGTTDDFKDAWFVGFSASVVAGVWVGFDRPAPIAPDGFGSRYALPIWAEFMTRIARLRPPEEFRAPSSVRGEQICSVTYLRANSGCPAYQEYFKAGDRPPEGVCELHRGGPSRAAAAIGGVFQRLGRGLRRLFGR